MGDGQTKNTESAATLKARQEADAQKMRQKQEVSSERPVSATL